MILVTGATGSIGGHLVRRLHAAGVPCTAFVRDEAKGRALGCPYVVGDLDDHDSVAAAMAGVDRLFLNAGAVAPVEGEQPMVAQQKAAIDAAVAAGVSHVVKISVWGAKEGGLLAEGAHWAVERHLARAGVAWTVLRPSGFMQNFLTGAAVFTDDDGHIVGAYGSAPVSYLDCDDIAATAQALLTGAAPGGGTHVLTGPEALTHTEIAAKLSEVAGRVVRYVDLPADELTAVLTARGVPARFAADVATLYAEVAGGSLAATTGAVADLTGRAPRTFDDFLAEHRETVRRSWASGEVAEHVG